MKIILKNIKPVEVCKQQNNAGEIILKFTW